jgi:hypothetical protein
MTDWSVDSRPSKPFEIRKVRSAMQDTRTVSEKLRDIEQTYEYVMRDVRQWELSKGRKSTTQK